MCGLLFAVVATTISSTASNSQLCLHPLSLQDDRAAVEDRFFSIIKAMNLSHLETAALRLAIARDDEVA